MPSKIRVEVDTDHAGCVLTRRSTTGVVVMFGRHTLKHASNLQNVISLASGESEYYGMTKGAALGLGVQALLKDWHVDVQVEVASDSSAARGFGNRRGLGRQRHVQTRYLWLQERIAAKHLTVVRVGTDDNRADMLTKPVTSAVLHRHMQGINQEFREGRAEIQRDIAE